MVTILLIVVIIMGNKYASVDKKPPLSTIKAPVVIRDTKDTVCMHYLEYKDGKVFNTKLCYIPIRLKEEEF